MQNRSPQASANPTAARASELPNDLDWEDVCGHMQVCASIAVGDGYWPSMISVDGMELNGTITSDDARSLAAMLVRAADACDRSSEEAMQR